MISAEKVMNIKVVELIKIYNFYFAYLFIRHGGNNVRTTLSYEEMTKIKVVDLDEFYNFYVHDFFS